MKVSAKASDVYRKVRDRGDVHYTLEELAKELHMSKTAVSRALWELEEAGALTIEEE